MESGNTSLPDHVKGYTDYLDKEMTIMGILSTFSIVSLGFVAEKLLFPGKDIDNSFWEDDTFLCFMGLAGFLFAGWSFYRERALLAWHLGQISLYKATGEEEKVKSQLTNSDAWSNWTWYQAGFGGLFLAFTSLGAVSLSSICLFVQKWQVLIGFGCLLVSSACSGFTIIAYLRFPMEDRPIAALWRKMFRRA